MAKFKDEFYRKLFSLVVPIMIQSFMLSLVSATDAIMLGLVDQDSLSAVSLAGQVQFVLSLFVSAIATGMGIIAAQYWGKQDLGSIERVAPIALKANLVFSLVFTIWAAAAPQVLMRFFTGEEALIAYGSDYLRAVSLSYFLCGVSQIYLTVLKNTGCAAVSSRISSCAVVINIVLNAVLIFGLLGAPRLGIVGAAYATVISRLVELLWSAAETRRPGRVRIRWRGLFRRERELGRDFWRYTVPVMGAALVWGLATTMYSVIMGHMGSDAVAANSITSIAKNLLSCLIRGLSGGTAIMIGNLLGANEFSKAKDYAKRLVKLSAIVGAATGGVLMLISPVIVRYSSFTDEASRYLQGMLLFCGVNVMAQSINTTVFDGIFCSGGDSRFDMLGNIFAMWCFSVPLGFIAAFWLKLPVLAVYCIVNLDEFVKMPAMFKHYKKYIWLRNITH